MRILGLGIVVVDHVLTLPRHPAPDTKNEATSGLLHGGGPVPVALAQLRRFGWQAGFVSRWGTDPFGRYVEQWLEQEGIEFPNGCRHGNSTGVSHVWIERNTGLRTSVTIRPDAQGLESLVDERRLRTFDAIHLDGWAAPAAIRAARLMQDREGLVCLDTGSPKPGIENLLSMADVVNAPLKFCKQLFGTDDWFAGSRRLAEFGPRIVTVTDGERGAVLRARGDCWIGRPLPLKHVVDTNGAGDVFSAALIHAVSRGFPVENVLQFAIAAAALKCQSPTESRLIADEQTVLACMDQVPTEPRRD